MVRLLLSLWVVVIIGRRSNCIGVAASKSCKSQAQMPHVILTAVAAVESYQGSYI